MITRTSSCKEEKTVKMLLKNAAIDTSEEEVVDTKSTNFHLACENGDEELVELLLEDTTIDVNKKGNSGGTGFYWSCLMGHEKIVEILLKVPGIDVNTEDKYGKPAFYYVCHKGFKRVAELLLKDERTLVNKGSYYNQTPFSRACISEKKEIVKLLLEDPRIDVNASDNDSITPFARVCLSGNQELMELLLKDPRIDFVKTFKHITIMGNFYENLSKALDSAADSTLHSWQNRNIEDSLPLFNILGLVKKMKLIFYPIVSIENDDSFTKAVSAIKICLGDERVKELTEKIEIVEDVVTHAIMYLLGDKFVKEDIDDPINRFLSITQKLPFNIQSILVKIMFDVYHKDLSIQDESIGLSLYLEESYSVEFIGEKLEDCE